MRGRDSTGEAGADDVDSHAATIEPTDAPADTAAAVKTGATATQSGTDSTMIAPTAMAEDSLPEAARGEVSASFPTADRGRYELDGEHARGGLGRIMRAHDRRLNRDVAIKELLRAGDSAEARFLREAMITARLEHPSIVPVHDIGRWSSGAPFYAMKLVSGSSLERRIADAPALEARLALLPNVVAVADAMAYAHSKGVIHRDLKPSNVVVGAFGETIVIDWGLAKDAELAEELHSVDPTASELTDGLTIVGAVMGTPAYMPPEQARGEAVDERADVYALGAMLYHLLTGKPPYEGERSNDVLRQVIAGPPAPIDARELGAPIDLVAVVDKAMSREPRDRYPTAQGLVDDLKRFQTGQLVTAHDYSAWTRVGRWLRRYRAAVAVAGVGVLVLAVFGAASVRRIVTEKRAAQQQRHLADAQRHAAETQRRLAEGRTIALLEEQGRRELLADRPLRALVYLSRAYSDGADTWRIRALLRDAMRVIDGASGVLEGHRGNIDATAWSPDSKLFLSAGRDGSVRVWDVAAGKEVGQLATRGVGITSLELDAARKRILTGGRDGKVRVWDAASRRELTSLDAHPSGVVAVAFAPHGRGFASAGNDGTTKLWTSAGVLRHEIEVRVPLMRDVEYDSTGTRLLAVDIKSARLYDAATAELLHTFAGHRQTILNAKISADGTRVATSSFDGTAQLYNTKTGALIASLTHTGAVQDVVFSPDSELLVTLTRAGEVFMWDAGNAKKLASLAHPQPVWSVAFANDGRRLATACSDGAARLWDAKTGGLIARLPGHRRAARQVVFSPNGRLLASVGEAGAIHLWKTDAWKLRRTINFRAGAIRFTPDGSTLATGGYDGRTRIWDVGSFIQVGVLDGRPSKPLGRLEWHSGMGPDRSRQAFENMIRSRAMQIRDVLFSPDGKRALTTTGDFTVRVWDLAKHALLHRLEGHRGSITAATFSPDGALIASAAVDGKVFLWDAHSGKRLRQLTAHQSKLDTAVVRFNRDGTQVATAGADGSIRLWRVDTGELVRVLAKHDGAVESLRYSADGRLVLSASADATVKVSNAQTGELITTLRHRKHVRSARFSRDGALVLTGSDDRTAKLWDARSGAMLVSYDDHINVVMHAAFSPDGNLVATVSTDGTAKIWDREGGALLATLSGHNGPVTSAVFHPSSRFIVTASKDGAVMVWDLSIETRTPAQISAIVARKVPWRLDGGRLMPRD